jgi:hypothetical protein
MPEDGYSLVNPLTLPWDTDILPANPHLAKQHRLSLQAPEYCYSPWKLLVNGASAIEASVPEGDERTLVLEAPPELFTPPFEIYYEVQADMSICRMTLQCLDRNGEVVCQVPVLLTPPGVFPEALAPKLATAGIERAQFTWGIRAACENGSLCLTANGNNFGGNLLQLPRAAEPVSFRIKLSAHLAGELKLQNLVLFFNR